MHYKVVKANYQKIRRVYNEVFGDNYGYNNGWKKEEYEKLSIRMLKELAQQEI